MISMTGLSGLSHSSSLSSMLSLRFFMVLCVVQCNLVSYRKDNSSYKSHCITTTAYILLFQPVSVSEQT